MSSRFARVIISSLIVIVLVVASLQLGSGASIAAPLAQETPATPTATITPTGTPQPAGDFFWSRVPTNQIGATAGASVTISGLQLSYPGTANITSAEFEIQVGGQPRGTGIEISPSPQFPLTRGGTRDILLLVNIPAGASGTVVLRITALKLSETPTGSTTPTPLTGSARTQATAFVTLVIAAGSPTATPNPCLEGRDPANRFEDAAVIRVNRVEDHGICRTGDVDWFKFAGVGGKRYTIDIVRSDPGLDLAIQLFDERRTLLDANDDFPLRNPEVPDLTDTRPRISGFLAPRDGTFYFRVYDVLGVGGANLTYQVLVSSDGFDPFPIVPSLCLDRFEPDGLPEQAQTILANDRHVGHRFCPAGDADWIRFFASKELVYYLYTDSRGPGGGNQPGADPLLNLFSRDGITLLDTSNNRAVGLSPGSQLDALIVFQPEADGIYFAQVKNVGDIGNNFMTYNLYLAACVSTATNCVPSDAPPPGQNPTPTPTVEFNLDPTPTP